MSDGVEAPSGALLDLIDQTQLDTAPLSMATSLESHDDRFEPVKSVIGGQNHLRGLGSTFFLQTVHFIV